MLKCYCNWFWFLPLIRFENTNSSLQMKHHVLVPLLLDHGHMYKTMVPTLPPSQLTCNLSRSPHISQQSGWCCGWHTGLVTQCSPGCSPAESPLPTLRDRQREAMRGSSTSEEKKCDIYCLYTLGIITHMQAVDIRQFSRLTQAWWQATRDAILPVSLAYLWLPWARWHSTWESVCLGEWGRRSSEFVAQIPCQAYDLPRLEPEWRIRGTRF